MNIKRLSYLLIALYSFTGCSKDDFDDYKIPPKMYSSELFEQYLLQNFDLDGDNHISIGEAKKVKKIEYSERDDISLSCLQYFTELESLHCSNTNIIDIDLTKSTKLKDVTCVGISFRGSALDLSKNVVLEVLEFTSDGGVLNLSNNVNLRKLNIRGFSLDSLSLKNNTELEKIYMNNVYIADLDFSYNKKLEDLHLSNLYDDENRSLRIENIPVKNIYCSNVSGLESVKLSGCDKLDSLYIRAQAYETGSIEVNIEDCSSLKYLSLTDGEYVFTGLNSCVKMEEISISGNIDLKDFDFSNMPELRELYCSNNNRFTTAEIKNAGKLEKVHFSDINNVDAVSIILSGNRSLKEIYCSNIDDINSLKISGCENLLSVNCNYLYNGNNKVQVSLDDYTTLEYLSLLGDSYSISDISSCMKLKEIRLDGVDLDISKNTELEYVYLQSGYLLAPIPNNKKIKILHCISIKDAEIFDLSNQLQLEELYCHNIIPVNIEHNKALRILDIAEFYYENTNLGTTSFSLKNYPYLSVVKFNHSGNLSSMEIENCPSLESLSFVYRYSIDTLKIANCATLNTLTCGYMSLKALDLRKCPGLESLWCWDNDISELDLSGAPGLKKLVCTNNKLEKLDVSKNIALMELNCEYNEQLTVLDLRNNINLRNFSCGNDKNPITVYLFKDYSQNKYVINGTIIYV